VPASRADGIGAAAKRLKRPLDKPAVGRADDGRALLNQVTEGAVVQADDLGSVWRRLAHRSRSESQAIEQGEHPGASIRDLDRPRARLVGEMPSGGAAGGGSPVGPVLSLSKRGAEDPSQEAIGTRVPFVGDEPRGHKDEPRASWAIGRQGLSADHPRVAQHVEVEPDRIEMQTDALGELVNFQRSFGAKRLKQADPARAAQGTVYPLIEWGQGWRNELGSRAHTV
jgi:hypothetical protein